MTSEMRTADDASRATIYQRKRLWCGIVGIGIVLNFLWWGTFVGLTRLPAVLPSWPLPVLCGLTALGLAIVVTLLQWPVDRAAQRVEQAFGQMRDVALVRQAYTARSLEWIGGVTVAGAALGVAIQMFGPNWPYASGLVLTAIGMAHVAIPILPAPRRSLSEQGRKWLASLHGELERLGQRLPTITFVDHGERSFAGGWHGIGPWRTLVLSTTMTSLPPRIAAGLVLREIGHRLLGHRIVSFYASLSWIVVGFIIAGATAPAWVTASSQAGIVVWVAMVISTWSWLGLFVWPALGRRQILRADAFAATLIGKTDALAMLNVLADRNLPDETLPPVVAWVFHPIPPMQTRRDAIARL